MRIPFVDLKAQHDSIRRELLQEFSAVIDASAFSGGRFVEKFEAEFADYCGTAFAIGVGSGTEALWLALVAHGVGPGDEVITVPNTFIATAESISACGAKPVFVDIETGTFNMDPLQLEAAISKNTKAVIPVHLFGKMADMGPICRIAGAHGIPVIEDAAQAHGATYSGKRAGSIGACGCFSFYPGKNLGALGEAGAITTNDPRLRDKMKAFRDHGQTSKHVHSVVGWNARMDGVQAAVLSLKLRRLDDSNDRRRDVAGRYWQNLRDRTDLVLPSSTTNREHVFHIYAARIPETPGSNRDLVMSELANAGIQCAVHYPTSIHLQDAYASLGLRAGSFPIAEKSSRELLSLPMYPELTNDQIDFVAAAMKSTLSRVQGFQSTD